MVYQMEVSNRAKGGSFLLFRAAVITSSDRSFQGEREDRSGQVLEDKIKKAGGSLIERITLPDEKEVLEKELSRLADEIKVEVIFTTGGTGLAPRDLTPDATKKVIDKEVPGMAEAMRMKSLEKTSHAMLSRAVCGIRKATLIINFPGSPQAVEENFELVLPAIFHAIETIRGQIDDCGN